MEWRGKGDGRYRGYVFEMHDFSSVIYSVQYSLHHSLR